MRDVSWILGSVSKRRSIVGGSCEDSSDDDDDDDVVSELSLSYDDSLDSSTESAWDVNEFP